MTKEKQKTANDYEDLKTVDKLPFATIGSILPWKKGKEIQKHPTTQKLQEILDGKEFDTEELRLVLKQIKKEVEEKEEMGKPEEPILMMIRDNMDVEIKEKVPSGDLKYERTDGMLAVTNLSNKKLLGFKWGDNVIRGWIAYEREGTALPVEPLYDSRIQLESYEAIVQNKKDFKAQEIKAKTGWINAIFGGIAILLLLLIIAQAFFGIDIIGAIFGGGTPAPGPETTEIVTQTGQTLVDAGTQTTQTATNPGG